MKKICSWIVILAMLMSVGTVLVSANEALPEGIAIRTSEELATMSADGTYYLDSDVMILGNWKYTEFKGTLDGNGHTIYFVNATVSGGLFESLAGGTVKNLSIVQLGNGVFNPVNEGVGAVAARASGHNVLIENVIVDVNIDVNANNVEVGGFVGNVRYITGSFVARNCIFAGSVINRVNITDHTYGGGIVGGTWASVKSMTFERCINYGTVESWQWTGGILGNTRAHTSDTSMNVKELIVKECINYGTVKAANGDAAGGVVARHNLYAGCTAMYINNINYGVVSAPRNNTTTGDTCVGGIGGRVVADNVSLDRVTKMSGNINYGTVIGNASDSRVGSIIANMYGKNGGSVPGSERVNNWYQGTYSAGDGYVNQSAPKSSVVTGSLITDANAVLSTLNAAYPDTFALGTDGKIVLAWTVGTDYDADFEVDIPDLSDTGEPMPGTVTLDVQIPEAQGTAISTAEELKAVTGDGSYYLTQDIIITGSWKSPVGFSGVLHGNGHAIVLNGAEIRGGLFSELAGGKFYCLTVTEGVGEGAERNNFRALMPNDVTMCFGTIAATGYGTFVDVTVNCAVGETLKEIPNAYVGGFVGWLSDGDSVFYQCKNLSDVKGGFAGGFTSALNGGDCKVEFSRCINYGDVTSSAGGAGGFVGIHKGLVTRILVSECVNYGAITTSADYCGGIIGSQKNTFRGSAMFLKNINYGTITNTSEEGRAAGLIGELGVNFFVGTTISGNVNYGTVTAANDPNQFVSNVTNNDNLITADNNFAGMADLIATVDQITVSAVDANTLNALNNAYENTFAVQGEQIGLKWASDLGLSSEKPIVNYTVSLLPPDENGGNEDGTDNGTTDTTDNDTTSAPVDTNEPATEEPADTEEGNFIDKITGCFSVVGGSTALMLMLMLGVGCTALGKKSKMFLIYRA